MELTKMRYNLQPKMARRRTAGWRKFCSVIDVFKAMSPGYCSRLFKCHHVETGDIRKRDLVTDGG